MEVFHYVANQLQGVSNFDNPNRKVNEMEQNMGAIYNDFDHDSSRLMDDDNESIIFSQSTNLLEDDKIVASVMPQLAVDYAILESDRTEGTLYPHLVIDHELVDVTSSARDPKYLDKVYKIVVFEWKSISTEMTGKTFDIYNMRHRSNWEGADSVYDAWLILNRRRRKWFSYTKFCRTFPHWQKARDDFEKNDNRSSDESCGEERDDKELVKVMCFPSDTVIVVSDEEVDMVINKENTDLFVNDSVADFPIICFSPTKLFV